MIFFLSPEQFFHPLDLGVGQLLNSSFARFLVVGGDSLSLAAFFT